MGIVKPFLKKGKSSVFFSWNLVWEISSQKGNKQQKKLIKIEKQKIWFYKDKLKIFTKTTVSVLFPHTPECKASWITVVAFLNMHHSAGMLKPLKACLPGQIIMELCHYWEWKELWLLNMRITKEVQGSSSATLLCSQPLHSPMHNSISIKSKS